jgi:hypothetical protein
MKKQFNVRLSSEALLAIKVAAKENNCTEAGVIELWAGARIVLPPHFAPPGGADAYKDVRIQDWSNVQLEGIPPKPTTLADKKAAAMAALAGLKNSGTPIIGSAEMGLDEYNAQLKTRDLHETPCAPFDVNLEGEPHRITQFGKRLGLCYMGGGEPVFSRYLNPGELETFWEKRNK